MTAVGGDFQLNVTRPNYGVWTTSQVDSATAAPLRAVPAGLVSPAQGLKRFLSIRFLDSRGRVARAQLLTFCPSGEMARVDDTGSASPTYPFGCSSGFPFFPFTRGIVWGIASGWAVQPAFGGFGGFGPFGPFGPAPDRPGVGGPRVGGPGVSPGPCIPRALPPGGISLKPGRYTVVASITAPYRSLFEIPAEQASATVQVKVTPTKLPRFCRRLRPPRTPDTTATAAGRLSAPTVTQPDPATLPNLVALPAWRIQIERTSRHRELLSFSATIWNAGPAALTIEGYRRPGSNVMDAFEYFSDASGNVVGRAPAGTLIYDNARGHHHWHIAQLASYDLVEPSGHVVVSQKQSFCIAPTNPVDLTLPGASFGSIFGGLGFGGSVCDLFDPAAIWLREQLPVGYGDTYTQSVAGQAFDITNLPNGTYRVEVRVNPLGLLLETSTADDVATRVIRLSGHGRARKVTVLPWHGIRG